MRNLICFFLLFLSVPIISAQNISGKVVDENNEPISFANVVVLSLPDSTFIQGTVTGEQGEFQVSSGTTIKKLLQVSYIGYESVSIPGVTGDVGTLKLTPSSVILEEAVVTASRTVHRLKNGNLVTDVANSPLSKEHSSMNLLKKIPGMTLVHGSLEVFGAGEPIIYINGKKISSKEEITMLDPKNIKEVELITNPGAKYDAEGKAVLKITTLNREDGWTARLGVSAIQSRRFSDEESVGITYKKKGLTLSGLYSFGDYRDHTKQDFENSLHNEEALWSYDNRLNTDNSTKQHNYQVSLDYSINEKHALGVQYTGTHNKLDSHAHGTEFVWSDKKEFADISSASRYAIDGSTNHFNVFYLGSLSKQLTLEANADYVKNSNDQQQNVNETAKEKNNKVEIHTDTQNELYAVKLQLDYALGKTGTFSFGGEFSKIKVDGWLKNPDETVESTRFNNREDKQAGYFMYDVILGKVNINAGVRYEAVQSEMNDLLDATNNIHRTYHDWFPNLSVSTTLGATRTALSYSVRTTRPAFSRLNSNTYYDNQFSVQLGNPLLQSQQSHHVQVMFGYQFLNLRLTYNYIKDYVGSVLSSEGNIIVNSWKNYNKMQLFRANLNLTHTFGWWNTTLSGGVSVPSFKIEYRGTDYCNNTPQVYAQSNNYLALPAGFTFIVDYMYNNGGSIGIYKYKPYHSLNLGLQKSFFKERLDVSLNANDLFRTMVYEYDSRIANIRFYQREDQDERYFSVGIIYRFNKMKTNQYRGTGAANEEMQRL